MPHIFGKILIKATTLLENSCQSKTCTKRYGLPKSWESQFWEFQDSQLGSPRIKWCLDVAPVANDREYYKVEGGGFPKSGPW
jgi:hypothetical protein